MSSSYSTILLVITLDINQKELEKHNLSLQVEMGEFKFFHLFVDCFFVRFFPTVLKNAVRCSKSYH